jgi:hypothetical protein
VFPDGVVGFVLIKLLLSELLISSNFVKSLALIALHLIHGNSNIYLNGWPPLFALVYDIWIFRIGPIMLSKGRKSIVCNKLRRMEYPSFRY